MTIEIASSDRLGGFDICTAFTETTVEDGSGPKQLEGKVSPVIKLIGVASSPMQRKKNRNDTMYIMTAPSAGYDIPNFL